MMMMKYFVSPVAALFCLCGVCSPILAAPTPDGAAFVAAMDEFCAAMESLCRICSGIRDKASADSAGMPLRRSFQDMLKAQKKVELLKSKADKMNEDDLAAVQKLMPGIDKYKNQFQAEMERLKKEKLYGSQQLAYSLKNIATPLPEKFSSEGLAVVMAVDEFCISVRNINQLFASIHDKASADAAAELLLPAFLGMNEKHNKFKVLSKNKLNEKDNAALKSRQMMLDKLSKENAALLEKLKNVRFYGSTKLVEAMQKVKDIK